MAEEPSGHADGGRVAPADARLAALSVARSVDRASTAVLRARGLSIAGLVLAIALGCGARPAHAADDGAAPAAVPYRPTVSTPATLSAPGWLEGELGFVQARTHDGDEDLPRRRESLPYALKYAFDDDTGVRVVGEALVHEHDRDGSHALGFGDMGLVGKRRFAIDASRAFGLEAGLEVPTARHRLDAGSGKPDWTVNGIYSADHGDWHTDVNVADTRLGARSPGQSRMQTLGAAAVSHPVDGSLSAAAELSGTRQHGARGTAQALAAFALALRRDLVVDFGAAHALNRASASWQAFAGFTMVLGRVH